MTVISGYVLVFHNTSQKIDGVLPSQGKTREPLDKELSSEGSTGIVPRSRWKPREPLDRREHRYSAPEPREAKGAA